MRYGADGTGHARSGWRSIQPLIAMIAMIALLGAAPPALATPIALKEAFPVRRAMAGWLRADVAAASSR